MFSSSLDANKVKELFKKMVLGKAGAILQAVAAEDEQLLKTTVMVMRTSLDEVREILLETYQKTPIESQELLEGKAAEWERAWMTAMQSFQGDNAEDLHAFLFANDKNSSTK